MRAIIKGEKHMKSTKRMSGLKGVLAIAAVLAMTGTASAKKASAPGVPGTLSPDRTSATVTVTIPTCDSTLVTPSLSVYIFQPSGRLINIGTANPAVTCGAIEQEVSVEVNAIPGLAFKPGPATLLIRFTTIDIATSAQTVSESGSRVDLHP